MPYDNATLRGDVQALIPEEVSRVMMTNLVDQSAALSLFQRVPISTNQTRMPVLSALPMAYFVEGDTGYKQTTKVAWANKYLNVQEIATIVPVPEAVAADVDFDFWENVRPLIEQAIGRRLDAAVFFGVNKPNDWPDDIAALATATGNTVTMGTATAAQGGLATDISNLFGLLEGQGQDITGVVARMSLRAFARNARDANGQQLPEITPTEWWNARVVYPMRGLWPTGAGTVQAFVGDFTQAILGVRQDITWKLLTEGVIQDPADGSIVYNLAQQDMVAMRVVARYAYQVANPIVYDELSEDARFPFGVLLSAGS